MPPSPGRSMEVAELPSTCQGSGDVLQLALFEERKATAGLGKARVLDGMLVMAATLLGGSGMLGIPHAFASAGWLLGMLLMVVFCLLSAFGSHLLQCSARKIGQAPCSFYTAAEAVAPSWVWLIDGAVAVKCFGVATSYLIIVGDLAPTALQHFGWRTVRRWQVVTIGFAIGGTLSLLKNLSKLRYTATGSLLIVLWTAVLIVLFFVRPGSDFEPCAGDSLPCGHAKFEAVSSASAVTLIKAFPVFIFGFTCQQNVFTICNEVKNATRRRIDMVILGAYSTAFVCFASAAFFGYATYGSQVTSDVLYAYPTNSVVQATRILYSFVAIFSFPLQIHPSRLSTLALIEFFYGCKTRGAREDGGNVALVQPAGEVWSARKSRTAFMLVTAGLLAGTFTIALVVTDLGKILGVVGATGSTTVSYILPGLVYSQAFTEPSVERRLAQLQLLLGLIIMPLCLTIVFIG